MTTIINPDRDLFQKRLLIVGMLSELGKYGMPMSRKVKVFNIAKEYYPITRKTKYDKFIQYIDFLFKDDIINADELKQYAIKAKHRMQEN